jgi:hypothetical protein
MEVMFLPILKRELKIAKNANNKKERYKQYKG